MEGVNRRDFTAKTGVQIDELIAASLKKYVDLGLLSDNGHQIRLTREGLFVSDAIWPEIL
jgi:oxygen-independent coproporphyrinogen-3 oxidase